MAQVILPVTMSVVQKKLYKSILEKSPELLRAIVGKDQAQLRPTERGSLNNILMQLRKCLCHPFVYSEAIEERSASRAVLHRNLVGASSKLELLEIMLPKLQERGHRVLIFSQFLKQLDIIEDFLDGLGLQFQRLDGNVGTLEKQKRIDAYNAADSPLFAFLLSTRAGGVGINLATADTVIIMDPDFNPHQDIQALSRAHRIGQKKKVLVFQLMTKDSAEEKIVQIGRKKMALDHALIESMDADDDAGVDLQSILKHGASALFEGDDQNDIRYDSASVDKLLDRTQVENTETGDDKSAESQFSYARIWANDSATLTADVGDADSDCPDTTDWERILNEREEIARKEAEAKQKQFGRGKRARQVCFSIQYSFILLIILQTVDYEKSHMFGDDDNLGPLLGLKKNDADHSDTDFAVRQDSDADDYSDARIGGTSKFLILFVVVIDDSAGKGRQGTHKKLITPRKNLLKPTKPITPQKVARLPKASKALPLKEPSSKMEGKAALKRVEHERKAAGILQTSSSSKNPLLKKVAARAANPPIEKSPVPRSAYARKTLPGSSGSAKQSVNPTLNYQIARKTVPRAVPRASAGAMLKAPLSSNPPSAKYTAHPHNPSPRPRPKPAQIFSSGNESCARTKIPRDAMAQGGGLPGAAAPWSREEWDMKLAELRQKPEMMARAFAEVASRLIPRPLQNLPVFPRNLVHRKPSSDVQGPGEPQTPSASESL
jgi:hypothetical protein